MLALVAPPVAKKRRLSGTLSDRLKLLLAEQDKGIADLARDTGIHRVSLSRIVNGQVTDPAVSIVKKIAAALDVTIGDLVDDDPEPEHTPGKKPRK